MSNTLMEWTIRNPEYVHEYAHTHPTPTPQHWTRSVELIELTSTLGELRRVRGDYWAHERLQHTFSNTFITPGKHPCKVGVRSDVGLLRPTIGHGGFANAIVRLGGS